MNLWRVFVFFLDNCRTPLYVKVKLNLMSDLKGKTSQLNLV